MKNLDNIKSVVSWNSRKNLDGTFTANVFSLEYPNISINHASCKRPTRAQAVRAAKKCVRYIKAEQAKCQAT